MISNNYKIYVDMDGVLSDWEAQFKRYSGGVPVSTYDSLYGKKNSYKLVNKNSPDYYATMPTHCGKHCLMVVSHSLQRLLPVPRFVRQLP